MKGLDSNIANSNGEIIGLGVVRKFSGKTMVSVLSFPCDSDYFSEKRKRFFPLCTDVHGS